jgi:hypothetical protein
MCSTDPQRRRLDDAVRVAGNIDAALTEALPPPRREPFLKGAAAQVNQRELAKAAVLKWEVADSSAERIRHDNVNTEHSGNPQATRL